MKMKIVLVSLFVVLLLSGCQIKVIDETTSVIPTNITYPTNYLIEEFSIEEYSSVLERYSVNKNVGKVETAEKAIEISRELWEEKDYFDVLPITIDEVEEVVKYDFKEDCWCVIGMINIQNVLSANPMAIISKDGDVIAVWLG